MNEKEIIEAEQRLGLELPKFYKETMLNYPFREGSIAIDCMLPQYPELLEVENGVIPNENKYLAIGSDGGELIFFLRLNGSETVYIHDAESSGLHHSIEARTWKEYLNKISNIDQETQEEEKAYTDRKLKKKWWQFWI